VHNDPGAADDSPAISVVEPLDQKPAAPVTKEVMVEAVKP